MEKDFSRNLTFNGFNRRMVFSYFELVLLFVTGNLRLPCRTYRLIFLPVWLLLCFLEEKTDRYFEIL